MSNIRPDPISSAPYRTPIATVDLKRELETSIPPLQEMQTQLRAVLGGYESKVTVSAGLTNAIRQQTLRSDYLFRQNPILHSRLVEILDAYDSGIIGALTLICSLGDCLYRDFVLDFSLRVQAMPLQTHLYRFSSDGLTQYPLLRHLTEIAHLFTPGLGCYINSIEIRDGIDDQIDTLTYADASSSASFTTGLWQVLNLPNLAQETPSAQSNTMHFHPHFHPAMILGAIHLARSDKAMGVHLTTFDPNNPDEGSGENHLQALDTVYSLLQKNERPGEINFFRRPELPLHSNSGEHPFILMMHDIFHVASHDAHDEAMLHFIEKWNQALKKMDPSNIWTRWARGLLYDYPQRRINYGPTLEEEYIDDYFGALNFFAHIRQGALAADLTDTPENNVRKWQAFHREFGQRLDLDFASSRHLERIRKGHQEMLRLPPKFRHPSAWAKNNRGLNLRAVRGHAVHI